MKSSIPPTSLPSKRVSQNTRLQTKTPRLPTKNKPNSKTKARPSTPAKKKYTQCKGGDAKLTAQQDRIVLGVSSVLTHEARPVHTKPMTNSPNKYFKHN